MEKSKKGNEPIHCLLCASENNAFFFRDKFREYRRCKTCSLIFVPTIFHVSAEGEKARYDQHNNDPDDIRYRRFLERIVPPIRERFEAGARGLDFGCGPTPLLANILREEGFAMDVYDLFYARDEKPLEKSYDFIVSTEVLEHLANPLTEIKKLLAMIEASGVLAVMTRLYDDAIDFRGWHYKNDQTHICFYTLETLDWLSTHLGITCERIEKDIFIFEK